jgi:alanyl-tRNA synthetase
MHTSRVPSLAASLAPVLRLLQEQADRIGRLEEIVAAQPDAAEAALRARMEEQEAEDARAERLRRQLSQVRPRRDCRADKAGIAGIGVVAVAGATPLAKLSNSAVCRCAQVQDSVATLEAQHAVLAAHSKQQQAAAAAAAQRVVALEAQLFNRSGGADGNDAAWRVPPLEQEQGPGSGMQGDGGGGGGGGLVERVGRLEDLIPQSEKEAKQREVGGRASPHRR